MSTSQTTETKPPEETRRVVVLGASKNPERYAHKALVRLREAGYSVVPVHPALPEIEGIPVAPRLGQVEGDAHTVTVYVGAKNLPALTAEILELRPQRVIFNPGTEHPETMEAVDQAGIECVQGCTLVMLATGQF